MASVNRRQNVESSSVSNESKESSGFNFIHFGCWNNDGCGDKYPSSGLTKTMTKLETELPKINPEIVLVTGDNYYPLKTTEPESKITKKEFNQDVFDSGWGCLKSVLPADKTYVLLGNHDLEEKGKKEKSLDKEKDKKEKSKNESNVAEKESVKKDEAGKKEKKDKKEKQGPNPDKCIINDELAHLRDFKTVDLCSVKVIKSTMFVMFTSTVYDNNFDFNPNWETLPEVTDEEKELKKDEEKAAKKNAVFRTCAQFIKAYSGEEFKNKSDLSKFRATATKIITDETKQALKSLTIPISNLVFVCHEPLISWKSKKGKEPIIITFGGEEYMNLLCGIIDMVKPTNTYYLCADLHQYQSGVIDIGCAECKTKYQITQNISGTGGAEQDNQVMGKNNIKSSPESKTAYGKYTVEYTMSKSDKRFGFTKATVHAGNGISFKFVPAETEPLVGGKRRKTKTTTKRRTKYVMKTTGKKW